MPIKNILKTAHMSIEIIEACRSLHGDGWPKKRNEILEKYFDPHMKEHKCKNRLSAAVQLCHGAPPQNVMHFIGAALDDHPDQPLQ